MIIQNVGKYLPEGPLMTTCCRGVPTTPWMRGPPVRSVPAAGVIGRVGVPLVMKIDFPWPGF